MRAGDLNETVSLLKRVVTDSDYGGQVETWSTEGTYRADIASQSGNIAVVNGIEQLETTVMRFIVRRHVPVVVGDRFVWRGNTYHVASVVPDRFKAWLQVTAELINS